MQTVVRKTQRKGVRSTQNVKSLKNTEQKMNLFKMFERFINYKQTEGLAKPTIQGYYEHFHYLNTLLDGDIPNVEVTLGLFRDYIGYMLHEQGLKPTPVNVRIRTNRAFFRHCNQEGWIEIPIHETFKPIKTPEDKIQAFTPAEVKVLLNQIDDSRFVGFRDKVMIYVLLDTMVRFLNYLI
ncbi:tyrosine-type recombinase/integrase [Neobacillus sp. LXY-1]|uniref:tyrosine-type recombinase/integrase n=1 Tax=Neobacillus sp. LXY-1 TaxID=3379133 RepID=UPI003EDEA184